MAIRIGRLFETVRARKGHTCKFARCLQSGVAARNLKHVPFAAKSSSSHGCRNECRGKFAIMIGADCSKRSETKRSEAHPRKLR